MKKCPSNRGFTLLEVLFAVAILGLGLVYLLQAQTRSMRMAAKGRALIVATELARKKMLDCKADLLTKGFSFTDYESEGDFSDDGFENITWECHGTRFDMPAPSADAISKAMKMQGGAGADQPGGPLQASLVVPFFALVANTLGDSVRELSAIVRWKVGQEDQELKVTTHVIDTAALTRAGG